MRLLLPILFPILLAVALAGCAARRPDVVSTVDTPRVAINNVGEGLDRVETHTTQALKLAVALSPENIVALKAQLTLLLQNIIGDYKFIKAKNAEAAATAETAEQRERQKDEYIAALLSKDEAKLFFVRGGIAWTALGSLALVCAFIFKAPGKVYNRSILFVAGVTLAVGGLWLTIGYFIGPIRVAILIGLAAAVAATLAILGFLGVRIYVEWRRKHRAETVSTAVMASAKAAIDVAGEMSAPVQQAMIRAMDAVQTAVPGTKDAVDEFQGKRPLTKRKG